MNVAPLKRLFISDRTRARRYELDPALCTRLLVMQPTPFCNINCDYCYLPDRSDKSKMSLRTVETAIERLVVNRLVGPELTVVWHAGEPLACTPEFYKSAFAIIDQKIGPSVRITHSIQTNGILINKKWCNLFRKFHVQVGISIDGPEHLHDAHRKTRDGKGTHHLVLRGIELLKRHDISFSVIAVVTADTVEYPELLFDYFRELGARSIGFSFDEAEGSNLHSSLAGKIDRHRTFMKKLFDLYTTFSASAVPRIREFDNATRVIANDIPSIRFGQASVPDTTQVTPFRIISVSWNGDFSTFSPELLGQPSVEFGNFVLGNVHVTGFIEALGTEAFARIWEPIADGLGICESRCRYFRYCGGGSPGNKLFENGSFASGETLYCRAMIQNPFDVVLEGLETRLEHRLTDQPEA